MDIEPLRLASMFAMKPNSLGYCGRDSASSKLYNCAVEGKCEGVQEELEKFIALYPYLWTISDISGLPIFSYEVVSAYWLGNDLLKKFKPEYFPILLERFIKQGVPRWFVDNLRDNEPKEFIPFHLFQVLNIGVGKLSGAVPFNLDSINNCMVRWGTVKGFNGSQASIDLHSLSRVDDKYNLVSGVNDFEINNNSFIPNLAIGQNVAVHWNMIVKELDEEEVANLSYWTDRVLQSI